MLFVQVEKLNSSAMFLFFLLPGRELDGKLEVTFPLVCGLIFAGIVRVAIRSLKI
jgi:hypothetical protein